MHERARLVGEEAHHATHDGSGIRQREAPELRGRHGRGIATRGTGHDARQLVLRHGALVLGNQSVGGELDLGGNLIGGLAEGASLRGRGDSVIDSLSGL